MANSPMSCQIPLSKPELRLFCWRLRCLGRLRAWLRRGRHQFGQPDQVVGRSREREHPTNAGKAAMMGLAKAGNRLGPAKHLLELPPLLRLVLCLKRNHRRNRTAA